MGGAEWMALPGDVAPNQTIDIGVNLTAPGAPGEYQGYWQLQTPDGTTFGIGPSSTGNLWVKIRAIAPALPTVTARPGTQATLTAAARSATAPAAAVSPLRPTRTPTLTIEFAASACRAQWQANDGILSCPGKEGQVGGYVLPLKQDKLEDGTTTTLPTLLTVPSSSKDGYILGLYPQYLVENGDHFQAAVGCEANALSCSVLFRLSYLDASGAPHDLWSLGEFYDGKAFPLDLDLSPLAGQPVRLVLSVNSLGSAAGDRALWVGPHIAHFEASAAQIDATATATVAVPSATAGSTSTPASTPTMITASTATASSVPGTTAPSTPSILESIISFFRHLFSGK
jgi:hypothetical protein